MRVHHIALRTRKLAEVERFYGELLGLAIMRRHDGSALLDMSGVLLIIERCSAGDAGQQPPRDDHIAFEVDDQEGRAAIERFARAGVTAHEERDYVVSLRDPDGRRVELRTYPKSLDD